MDGPRAVAVALLVLAAAVGAASLGATQQASGPAMSIQPLDNTSDYLGPNASDIDRAGQQTTSLDVAATVSTNGGEVRSTYSRVTLQRKYRNADTDEERRAVVRNGTEQLTQRVDALEQREVEAIDRYADGEIGEADLFRVLSTVEVEANDRAETADWLTERASELGMSAAVRRLSSLRIRLVPLRGPVRDDIVEGLDGKSTARIHAETADGGLVLATVRQRDDGGYVYVREAYDPAIRNVQEPDMYDGTSGVFNRLTDVYPWIEETPARVGSDWITAGDTRLYVIDYEHPHGRLTSYVDGGTGQVVKETQQKDPNEVPTTTINETSDSGEFRVTVETTHASGPLGVTIVEDATGEPLDASVSINDESIGRTDDGQLWTVGPRGEVVVTVTHRGESVVVETTL